MTLQNDRQLAVSIGASKRDINWTCVTMSVGELYDRLTTPAIGAETTEQYLHLTKAEQDVRKDVGGFVGGTLSGPRRKSTAVTGRDLITLDADTIGPFMADEVIGRAAAIGYGFAVYPTRKHRPEAPRLRFIFPACRTMTVDEYDAVARKVAEKIGLETMDPTTFEAARLMFWPSCNRDSDYQLRYADAPLLDVDAVLAEYNDWRNFSERPRPAGEFNYRPLAVKQGDPESKPGIVGLFNRCYDVYTAMSELIPGVYSEAGERDRFTYCVGSTVGGAVVFEDGRFLYSFHATDPCSRKLVNAFDLVRLHKFGDMDATVTDGTPINRMPSFTAMTTFAAGLETVQQRGAQERYEAGTAEFAGAVTETSGSEGEKDTHSEATTAGGAGAWMQGLKLEINEKTGLLKPTIDNAVTVTLNDPVLKGSFGYNEFAGKRQILRRLPWDTVDWIPPTDTPGARRGWTDTDDAGLYWYFESRYAITNRAVIDTAAALAAQRNAFDDVKNYVEGLHWDGKPRLDTLLIDYLGARDDTDGYTRAVTRKSFVAAIRRAMEPGCKHDYMLILCGPQGQKKSSFLRKLSRGWFNDNIKSFDGKDAQEGLPGTWIVEIAELEAMNRSEVSRVKQFLSLQVDKYRAAYGRNVQEYPRRCVFFGTSNEHDFLQDLTGNRRFWPVDVDGTPTKDKEKDLTEEEIGQIWAEAKARWMLGESTYLSDEQEKVAKVRQEIHRNSSPMEGVIEEFISRKIPAGWKNWPLDRRREYWATGLHGEEVLVDRTEVTSAEIWCECFGKARGDFNRYDPRLREANATLRRLGWKDIGKRDSGCYGGQNTFRRTSEEA